MLSENPQRDPKGSQAAGGQSLDLQRAPSPPKALDSAYRCSPEKRPRAPERPKLIGLYDAYLSTLGGGENFIAVLAEVLEQEFPTAEIHLLTYPENSVPLDVLVKRFGVRLQRTQIRTLVPTARPYLRRIRPAHRLFHERDIAKISQEYDLFVNNTVFSVAPARAPLSVYMCMFPLDPRPWWLRNPGLKERLWSPYTEIRRLLYRKWIGGYDLLLANSEFTRSWIRRLWGLQSQVLYPAVETITDLSLARKRKAILAVGRFFPGNHNKKHGILIEAFSRLIESGLEGWELHLVGGRTRVPGTDSYIEALRKQARGLPVAFHIDAGRGDLNELFKTSALFWHATGYGEDLADRPEKLEHFGMSTVEAMTHGCVPVAYSCGGQPEIIEHSRSGFLWKDLDEFRTYTMRLISDSSLRQRMAALAHQRSQFFSRNTFHASVRELLSNHYA